jgi:tetratricopeptide (TPR) repeat protein
LRSPSGISRTGSGIRIYLRTIYARTAHRSYGGRFYYANLHRDGDTPADSLEWYGKAIRTQVAAYERDRQVILTRSALDKCHADWARAPNLLGKHLEAVPEWDRAVELAPPDRLLVLRALRATARAQAGQFAEALAELAEVTKTDPTDPIHWYNFARLRPPWSQPAGFTSTPRRCRAWSRGTSIDS